MTRRSTVRWRRRINRAVRAYRAAGNLGRWREGPNQTAAMRKYLHDVILTKTHVGEPEVEVEQGKEFVLAWSRLHLRTRSTRC